MAKPKRRLPTIDPAKPHTLQIAAIIGQAADKVLTDHGVKIQKAKLRRLTAAARLRRMEILAAVERDNLTHEAMIGATVEKLRAEHLDPTICVPTPVNPCF